MARSHPRRKPDRWHAAHSGAHSASARDGAARRASSSRRNGVASPAHIGQGKLKIGKHLAEALRCQWQAYGKRLKQTQKEFSNKNVHELRVETRRLMAQLRLIHCALPDAALKKACRTLRTRLGLLGDLRDVHVQIEFLKSACKQFPETKSFIRHLNRQERRLIRGVQEKLERLRGGKLNRCIRRICKKLTGQSQRQQQALAAAVTESTEAAFKRVRSRYEQINPAVLSSIHRTRVAFKRYRYMLEALPSDLHPPNQRKREELTAYQRLMGDIQDLAVMHARTLRFMEKHRKARRELLPFVRHLRRRTEQCVDQFLKNSLPEIHVQSGA